MDNIQLSKEVRSAIKRGDSKQCFELLGDNKNLINIITPFGTWLHVAASEGQVEIVEGLIKLGADVNIRGGVYGGSAINEAASEGHIEVVDFLLSHGADMDVSEPERNPLFGAISNGHVKVAELLIKTGIDTTVKYSGESMKNMDALAFAREQGQKEIEKMLESINDKRQDELTKQTHEQQDNILPKITMYFGQPTDKISEIIPGSRVAVDIHIISPSEGKDFLTLVTTGMSDYPMDESEEAREFKYAELLLKLPSNWPINKNEINDQSYWPIGWLRRTAHIPHKFDGWLMEGVILPNGEPPQPFASNTKLSCIMIRKVREVGLDKVITSQGHVVNLYSIIPIYVEEWVLALEKGVQYLLDRMDESGISDVIDIHRVNVGIKGRS